jgi:hypothetical protein
MEKIEVLILQTIEKYKGDYIDYDERGLQAHRRHCGKSLKKLRKMLKILD